MTCQMFFSSTLYDHEVLFNKKMQISVVKNDGLAFDALFDHSNVV